MKKLPKKRKPVPLSALVNSQVDMMQGMSLTAATKKNKIKPAAFRRATGRLGEVMATTSPTMAFERQLISDVISDRLKPIKEELAVKSLEIIRKADDIMVDRLLNKPKLIKTKDLLSISDVHSKRLARITGIEEDPGAGSDEPERAKFVNNYVNNIFHIHGEKLKEDRERVNDTTPTPIYDVDAEKA